MAGMKWLSNLVSILPLVPVVVAGIEQIHADTVSGAGKKQLALEALGLASGVAQNVLPGDTQEIEASTALAGSVIDAVVAMFNRTGVFGHGTAVAPPPPPPPPAVAGPTLGPGAPSVAHLSPVRRGGE
jgi:hypothetical protein